MEEKLNQPMEIIKESKSFWFLFGYPIKPRFEYNAKDGYISTSTELSMKMSDEIRISTPSLDECIDKLMSDPMYQFLLINAEYQFVACKRELITLKDDLELSVYDDRYSLPRPKKSDLTPEKIDPSFLTAISYGMVRLDSSNLKEEPKPIQLYSDSDIKSHIEVFELMKLHKNYPELEEEVKRKEYSFFEEEKKSEAARIANKRKADVQFMKNYIKRYPEEAKKYLDEMDVSDEI